jgi:hypothetical protein
MQVRSLPEASAPIPDLATSREAPNPPSEARQQAELESLKLRPQKHAATTFRQDGGSCEPHGHSGK